MEPELELQPSGPSLSSTMAKQTQRSMSLSGTQSRSTIRSLSHANFFLLLCMLFSLSFLPLYHPHLVQSKNFLFLSLIFFLLKQVSLFPSLFNSFTFSLALLLFAVSPYCIFSLYLGTIVQHTIGCTGSDQKKPNRFRLRFRRITMDQLSR